MKFSCCDLAIAVFYPLLVIGTSIYTAVQTLRGKENSTNNPKLLEVIEALPAAAIRSRDGKYYSK